MSILFNKNTYIFIGCLHGRQLFLMHCITVGEETKREVVIVAVDWLKIKNEYINGGGSYRKLAEKYGVSVTAIANKAKVEQWLKLKDKQLNRTCTKVVQKTSEKIADQEASRIAKLLIMSDKLGEQLDRAIGELDQQTVKNRTRHREIEYTDPNAPGKPTREIIKETEEVKAVVCAIDRLGLQQLSTALKNLKDTMIAIDTGSGRDQEDDPITKSIKEELDK